MVGQKLTINRDNVSACGRRTERFKIGEIPPHTRHSRGAAVFVIAFSNLGGGPRQKRTG
jgi:hypothetical protein